MNLIVIEIHLELTIPYVKMKNLILLYHLNISNIIYLSRESQKQVRNTY